MPWSTLARVRADAPLIHNITNYVVMNQTANALLAVGASPVMAHAVEEIEEMAGIASALVINIGTLSGPWIEAMLRAGIVAHRKGIPIVLDPVGCGATAFRTITARMLVDKAPPTIIRGNASEILALAGGVGATRGVDSTQSTDSVLDAAAALARTRGCVVSVSGATDLVIGDNTLIRVSNGHPMMSRVTGMGCTATAITGAFAAVSDSPLGAAADAMCVMGMCGQLAAEGAAGPGSFVPRFIDALATINETTSGALVAMTPRAPVPGTRG